MAKRDSYEDDDDFLDEEIADWDDDEEAGEDDEADAADDAEAEADDEEFDEDDTPSPTAADEDDEDADDAGDAEDAAEEEPVEEEIVYPPDDDKALAALKKLRVRLDTTEKGNVWRAILDDTNGKDPTLVLLKGLPALREVWLLGTKVSAKAAEVFREEHPKIRVFY